MGIKEQIEKLGSPELTVRDAAAEEIFVAGAILARRAGREWLIDEEMASLVGKDPTITVEIAVSPAAFEQIRTANSNPGMAEDTPDKDPITFALHLIGIALEV